MRSIKKWVFQQPIIIAIFIGIVFAVSAHAIGGLTPVESGGSSGVASDGTMSADLDGSATYGLINILNWFGGHETTDTPPTPSSINGRASWSQGTTSSNDGSLLSISAGQAALYVTVTNVGADATSDTLQIRWKSFAGLTTHSLIAGTDFVCTTIDGCVTNLAAAVSASTDTAASLQGTLTMKFVGVADLVNDRVEIYGYGDGYAEYLTCGDEGGGAGAMCTVTTNSPVTGDIWAGAQNIWLNATNTGLTTNGATVAVKVSGGTEMTISSTAISLEDPLNMTGNYIYSSSGELDIDAACTSGHAADVCVQGVTEFNGHAFFDAGFTSSGTAAFIALVYSQDNQRYMWGSKSGGDAGITWGAQYQTNDTWQFLLDTVSRTVMLIDADDWNIDYNITSATDPTLRIQSNDQTQVGDFIQFYHNQTNGVIDVGNGSLDIKDTVIFSATYQRDIDIDVNAAGVGITAPASVTWGGILRGLSFDADSEEAFIDVEVPSDWDGASDMTLKVSWVNETGTALANAETVIWDIDWRSIAVGEDIDAVAVATASATYTQSGAGTDGTLHSTSITIDYDHASHPLTAGDSLLIQFDRNMTGDSYIKDAVVLRWGLQYTSNALPEH